MIEGIVEVRLNYLTTSRICIYTFGDMTSATGGDEESIVTRIRCGSRRSLLQAYSPCR